MAADPSIFGNVSVKAPLPASPLQTATGLANLQDVQSQISQRNAQTEDLRSQAQLRIDQAKVQAVANAAAQQTGGDLRAAAKLAYQSDARAGKLLDDAADAKEKNAADTYKTQLGNTSAQAQSLASLAGAATPETWAALTPAMRALLPQSAQAQAPQLVPDQYSDNAKNGLVQMGVSAKDHTDQAAKNLELWMDGNHRNAIGKDFAAVGDDPAARQGVAARYKALGAPADEIAEFQNTPAAQIQTLLTTAEQDRTATDTETNNKALREQAAATLAQTTARDTAQAKNSAYEAQTGRMNAVTNRGELDLKKQATAAADIQPGTALYRQAQDLSDGTLTFADFQRLHSRAQADAPARAAVYDLARTMNPNFNPAQFELGYKFASSPKVQQQIASLKNVESGVDDLLKFSDAAARTGSPTLNQYGVKPIATMIGNKKYSNFNTAVTGFADELSGALGYGSATDMSRDMGFSMTDMNQSPENFKSNIRDVVLPFIARKKASIIGQMGPYGASQGGPPPAASDRVKVKGPNGQTGTAPKDSALPAGWSVVP